MDEMQRGNPQEPAKNLGRPPLSRGQRKRQRAKAAAKPLLARAPRADGLGQAMAQRVRTFALIEWGNLLKTGKPEDRQLAVRLFRVFRRQVTVNLARLSHKERGKVHVVLALFERTAHEARNDVLRAITPPAEVES